MTRLCLFTHFAHAVDVCLHVCPNAHSCDKLAQKTAHPPPPGAATVSFSDTYSSSVTQQGMHHEYYERPEAVSAGDHGDYTAAMALWAIIVGA